MGVSGDNAMTNELVLFIVTVVAGLSAAGVLSWMMRPRQRAVPSRRRAQGDDMFAYTMYDDPC